MLDSRYQFHSIPCPFQWFQASSLANNMEQAKLLISPSALFKFSAVQGLPQKGESNEN